MTACEWRGAGRVGAALGGVAVGFAVAGWITAAKAAGMAQQVGRDRDLVAMVPVCFDHSRADPATMGQAPRTGGRDAQLMNGRAHMHANQTPDRDLPDMCLQPIDVPSNRP